MRMPRNQSLKQILVDTRQIWDHDGTRAAVRQNLWKIINCGTPSLGAECYASGAEHLVVYHTCKSRFCPSCGYRATEFWREELEATLPDIHYVGINFTMPSVLWPIFQQNRHLFNDLPAIAASALRHWAQTKYGVSMFLIVVPQTFGGMLNFNPHLHMLVSAGGLQESNNRWISAMQFNESEIMEMWRLALVSYLWVVGRAGAARSPLRTGQLNKVLGEQAKRNWVIYVSPFMSKKKYFGYAGRYSRRAPIPLSKILEISDREVRFEAKDTRGRRVVQLVWPKEMFVRTLAQHVADHYRHAVRYFGLLAPRSQRRTSAALFALLKQAKRSRPVRLSWADSLQKDFGVTPLIDSHGHPMFRVGRQKPVRPDEPTMAA